MDVEDGSLSGSASERATKPLSLSNTNLISKRRFPVEYQFADTPVSAANRERCCFFDTLIVHPYIRPASFCVMKQLKLILCLIETKLVGVDHFSHDTSISFARLSPQGYILQFPKAIPCSVVH